MCKTMDEGMTFLNEKFEIPMIYKIYSKLSTNERKEQFLIHLLKVTMDEIRGILIPELQHELDYNINPDLVVSLDWVISLNNPITIETIIK